MRYRCTIVEDIHVVIVDDVTFYSIAVGRVFQNGLKKSFPEANGLFVVGYQDPDGVFVFPTPHQKISHGRLNDIPVENWITFSWE